MPIRWSDSSLISRGPLLGAAPLALSSYILMYILVPTSSPQLICQSLHCTSVWKQQLNVEYTELIVEYTELNVEYTELNVKYTELNVEYTELNVEYAELNVEYAELNMEYTDRA